MCVYWVERWGKGERTGRSVYPTTTYLLGTTLTLAAGLKRRRINGRHSSQRRNASMQVWEHVLLKDTSCWLIDAEIRQGGNLSDFCQSRFKTNTSVWLLLCASKALGKSVKWSNFVAFKWAFLKSRKNHKRRQPVRSYCEVLCFKNQQQQHLVCSYRW